MLFDVFKGWFAVFLTTLFTHQGLTPDQVVNVQIGAAVAAALGHVFPVFAGFRGGKGVGTLAGVGIFLFPWALLIVLGIFIIILSLTRYVSLASITASILFSILAIFVFHEQNTYLIILAALIAVFIPLTHHKNIRRLLKGQESKLSFRKK